MNRPAAVKMRDPALGRKFARQYSFLMLFVVLVIVASALSRQFLTAQNLFNIWQQASILGIVSIGATFVILTAGIDLSVGGIVAIAGMLASLLAEGGHHSPIVAVLAGLGIGAVVGLFNGLITVHGRVPSFIVTLATSSVAGGVALLVTHGAPIYNLPNAFQSIGGSYLGPVPVMGIVWILLSSVAAVVLKYTSFGRHVYAIGGNLAAAYLAGIKVRSYTILVFLISGFLAGLSGVLLASWLTVGYPNSGGTLPLESIAAVVLGGTSLFGGVGGIGGTVLGVLMLIIITNIFNLVGLPADFQEVGYGLLIVVAVLLSRVLSQSNDQ